MRFELAWIHQTLGAPAGIKYTEGTKLHQTVIAALFNSPSNQNRYTSIDDLLEACRLEDDQVMELSCFRYAARKCPRASVNMLVRMVVHRCCPMEERAFGTKQLRAAQQDLVGRRKKNPAVHPLVLRLYVALYANMAERERKALKLKLFKPIKATLALEDPQKQHVVEIIVVGDGYDRSLVQKETPLVTPCREALAPYAVCQNNRDVFLLTTNLTQLYEYLSTDFDAAERFNFAELYGSVFTSVTPSRQTKDHPHVINAQRKLQAFIEYHQTRRTKQVKVDIKFLGVGFVRNGEGLGVVLRPHASRYRSVSFFNRDKMSEHQRNRCRGYLGLKKSLNQVHWNEKVGSSLGKDFKVFLAKVARWPIPDLPTPEKCLSLRWERLNRCVPVAEIQESAGSHVLHAVTLVELELGKKHRRKSKRSSLIYKT